MPKFIIEVPVLYAEHYTVEVGSLEDILNIDTTSPEGRDALLSWVEPDDDTCTRDIRTFMPDEFKWQVLDEATSSFVAEIGSGEEMEP